MKHHGCRSHIRDQSKLTGQEERFDLVVDSNDVILERVVGLCFFAAATKSLIKKDSFHIRPSCLFTRGSSSTRPMV